MADAKGDVPAAKPVRRSPSQTGNYDRRTLIWSALLLTAVIVVGVGLVAANVKEGPRQDTQGQLTEEGGAKPHIIPRPNDGHRPTNNGDRGGWEQLALMGLIMGSMAGIGVVVFYGGRKARANRALWRAAGETGLDGVIDPLAPHGPPAVKR